MADKKSTSDTRADLLTKCEKTFLRYQELQHASNQLAFKALDAVQPDGASGLKKSNDLLRMAAEALREHHDAVRKYLGLIKS